MRNLVIILTILAFFSSCKKEDDFIVDIDKTSENEPNANEKFARDNFGNQIDANFIGRILNEEGEYIKDVEITIGNKTAYTDFNGVFVLNSVSVHDKFAFIKASKSGYILGSRTIVPTDIGRNDIQITLLEKNIVGVVNSGIHSEVGLRNGAKLGLSGDFIDASGNPYSGQVEVSMHYLEPNNNVTFAQMPGMLFGQQANGSSSAMETYGMITVNLFSPSGETLNISKDLPATLTFPISQTTPNVESEIPLWYFDSALGYWKEEGLAIIKDGQYVAEVNHFSWWNCDLPINSIKACINLRGQNSLSNHYMKIIRNKNSQVIFSGYTNKDGQECGLLPINENVTVKVYSDCLSDVRFEKILGPFSTDVTIDIEVPKNDDIIETQFIGSFNDCNGNPITNGYALLFEQENNFEFNDAILIDISNGVLNYNLTDCNVNKYNLLVYDLDAGNSAEIVNIETNTGITNLGVISTCDTTKERNIFKGNVVLNNQTEVNEFGAMEYTGVQGSLTTTGGTLNELDPIVNLSSLSSLTKITGTLKITSRKLNDLTGLRNLNTIGNSLYMHSNQLLASLSGLDKLTFIGNSLTIVNNDKLTDLSGFKSLTYVGSFINLSYNEVLSSLSGLDKLTEIQGDLTIESNVDFDNDLLTSLEGLNNVKSIEGNINIIGRHSLKNLSGLNNVTLVTGNIVVLDNALLENLSGLGNLTSIGGNLTIEKNNGLINLIGTKNLASIGGDVTFKFNQGLRNFSGLNNLNSIGGFLNVTSNSKMDSLSDLENLTSIGSYLAIIDIDNISDLSGLENLISIGGNLAINRNNALTTLLELNNLETIGGSLQIDSNRNLQSLSGLSNLKGEVADLGVSGNPLLLNLLGLDGLTSVTGFMSIYSNDGLQNLIGLDSITSVGGYLKIEQNSTIKSLSGLDNLNSVGGNLIIIFNDELISIPGFCPLTKLVNSGLYKQPDIRYNGGYGHIDLSLQNVIDGMCN